MSYRLSRLAVTALWLCAAVAGARADELKLNFDFAAAHPFGGIGAQVWMQSRHPAEAGAMLHDINAQMVRVSLLPRAPVEKLAAGMSVDRIVAVLAEAETPDQRHKLVDFRDQMKQLGIKPHLIFWHMPEEWEDAKQKKAGSKKEAHYVRPDRIPDYANLVTAQLVHLTRLGIEPGGVELTNEPQGAWDLKYEPEEYADLVVRTRQALDAAGLQRVRIEGPGTGLRNFKAFYKGLKSRNAMGAIGALTAHAYQSPQALANNETPGVEEFLGKGTLGPIIITEFGVKKHNAEDEDVAAADLDVDSADYAVATAAESLMLLGKGASSVIYWQLEDFNWSKKKHGMLTEAGQRRPVAAAVQALFGKVPGSGTQVAGTGGPASVPAEAVQADGKVYVLMVNTTAQPQQISARFSGVAPRKSVAGSAGYVDRGLSSNALTDITVKDGVLRATLAPKAAASVELH